MNQNGFDDSKDELFDIFLNRLVDLRTGNNYDKIKKVLNIDGENTHNYIGHENSNGAKYIDENSIIDVRIWTDKETKKILKILHYVCNNPDICISLNNKIVKYWLYITDNDLTRFMYRHSKFGCNRELRVTIKIEWQLWKEFVKRCEILDISVSKGFKVCINEFIEQEARINLDTHVQ